MRDVTSPDVWDANHARIGAAREADLAAFFEASEAAYAHCAHRAVRFDPRAPTGALEAELLRRGYACELFLLMALEGAPRGTPGEARIAAVEGADDWETFARLKQVEFAADGLDLPGAAWRDHLRRKSPPAVTWIARLGGEPVGLFSAFVRGEIAMLEDLFILPGARLRGVGTALVAHAALAARRAGASLCFLSARADDTPKDMYARMGFDAVGVTRSLLRAPR